MIAWNQFTLPFLTSMGRSGDGRKMSSQASTVSGSNIIYVEHPTSEAASQ